MQRHPSARHPIPSSSRPVPSAADPPVPSPRALPRVQAERAELERAAGAGVPCGECASKEREFARMRQALMDAQSARANSEAKAREDLDSLRGVESLVRNPAQSLLHTGRVACNVSRCLFRTVCGYCWGCCASRAW